MQFQFPPPQKRKNRKKLNSLKVCMWHESVCFIRGILKVPSFKTLKLQKAKWKLPLLAALPPQWSWVPRAIWSWPSWPTGATFPEKQLLCALPDPSGLPLCVSDPSTRLTLLLSQTYWAWKPSLLSRSKHRGWKQFEACLLMKALGLFFL